MPRLLVSATISPLEFNELQAGELDRMASKRPDFRTFYRDAHAVDCLTEREKMLIGLTVAMMRLCDP